MYKEMIDIFTCLLTWNCWSLAQTNCCFLRFSVARITCVDANQLMKHAVLCTFEIQIELCENETASLFKRFFIKRLNKESSVIPQHPLPTFLIHGYQVTYIACDANLAIFGTQSPPSYGNSSWTSSPRKPFYLVCSEFVGLTTPFGMRLLYVFGKSSFKLLTPHHLWCQNIILFLSLTLNETPPLNSTHRS